MSQSFRYGTGSFENVAGHNSPTAIKYLDRESKYHGPEYESRASKNWLDHRCLEPNSTWEVTAQFKLTTTDASGDETGQSCQLDQTNTNVSCPSVRIRIYEKANTGNSILDDRLYEYDVPTWEANGFNPFRAQFTVPNTFSTDLHDLRVIVRDFNAAYDVTIDDFSIRKVVA